MDQSICGAACGQCGYNVDGSEPDLIVYQKR